jgi:hypothetical protein
MPKAHDDAQKYYAEKTRNYETKIKDYLKREETVLAECRKAPDTAAVKLFSLSNDMLNLTSNYLAINGISAAVLTARNEEALNEARKTLYKAVIYIENVVTGKIHAPFSEYEENLNELSTITEEARYLLMRKLGLTIDLLKNAYGDNTKWKWSFVDIEGRFAAITKNLFDLKNVIANTRPDKHGYETHVRHLQLIKKLLSQTADRYNQRYQLSTKRPEDLRAAVNLLAALKYIHSILGEREAMETVQKKHENWTSLLEGTKKPLSA